jgi:hypothetical protein
VSTETFELNCPFCDKLYKLPREKVLKHAGRMIHCRKCGKPFSIPTLPGEELQIDSIPIAVAAQERAEESVVAQTPVEEEPPPVALAVSETIEPPPLTEYEMASTAHEEMESPAGNLSEQDAEAIATLGLSEDPPSYFAAPVITSETVELSGEPAFSMEAVSETPFAETRGMEELMGLADPVELAPLPGFEEEASEGALASGEMHTESPPPPLPSVPDVSPPPPPKARRTERISVMPVFDAEEEEQPVPRRKRFGKRAEAVAPVVVESPAPAVERVEATEEVPVVADAPAEPAAEAPEDLNAPVPKAEIAEPEAAPVAVSEDRPILLSNRAEPLGVSEEVMGVLVTIRRAVMLLAVMSVVIAVVLIAVLLAIMGIIPKR